MSHYILKESLELSVIGIFPQVEKNVGIFKPNTIQCIDLWGNLPAGSDFPDLQLRKKGKLTDMLSCASLYTSNALLISSRARERLIDQLNKVNNSEFKVNVYDSKGHRHQYYYFFFNDIDNNLIDFGKSTFLAFETLGIPRKGRIVQFSNDIEFVNYFKSLQMTDLLKNYKIYLLPNIIKPVFRIRGTMSGMFVSGDIKKIIETNNLTGFRFISSESLLENPSVTAGHYEIIE